jgi:sugar phosphate isomerase/epimerase
MEVEPGPGVFELARRIRGLSGVELQVHFKGTTLWDRETLLGYRAAAERTGLAIPSVAGVWPAGGTLFDGAAESTLRKAIAAAQALGASTILVACFEQNCPRMDDERSYAPVVALLEKLSGAARDAGVVLGMETSNTPAEDRKLIDLVDSPAVGVYYDLDNCERYHKGLATPGVALLGKRIRQVHMKNETRLLEEPGRVNWAEAVGALARAGYAGWFMFETAHSSAEQCVEATGRNIAFVTRLLGA